MAKFIEEFYYDILDPPPRHRNHQPRIDIHISNSALLVISRQE